MTIIQALERQNRRRESRRLAMSSVLLCLMVVLAFAVSGESKIGTTPSDPTVERLQTRTKEQADQLERLRQLFSFCRSSVNWSDDRCGNPTGTSSVGSLPVDTRVVRVNDSSDDGSDDSSSDDSRTVVVQRSRPTVSPTRGSQRPTHPRKSGEADGGNGDRHGNRDRPKGS